MSPLFRKTILFTLFALAQLSLLGQEVPPPPQRTPPSGLPMPIDGNIIMLVLVGLTLGVLFVVKKEVRKGMTNTQK